MSSDVPTSKIAEDGATGRYLQVLTNEEWQTVWQIIADKQEGTAMFEGIREAVRLVDAAHAWLLAQPLPMQVLAATGALAVLWVLWIVFRVLLVALRAAFRGL